jgi:hypothetical protein
LRDSRVVDCDASLDDEALKGEEESTTMSATAAEVPMVNVQVDGEWKQFPKGTRLIEACMKSGHFIPHYCYHPKLSSPGNCRMCLVELGMPKMNPERKPVLGADGRPEIAWSPRPAISCATEISEGMAVRTDSPLAEECRKGVMEFLLINHPLDCPICDQAGECRLQEFSVQFGNGGSRFVEEKVKKPKRVDIGPRIVLDDERCIMCSRCVRFMQEIAHDDVLGFVNRGSHTTLTVYPGKKPTAITAQHRGYCPGALTRWTSASMRVHFSERPYTRNAGSSNIPTGSRETPFPNPARKRLRQSVGCPTITGSISTTSTATNDSRNPPSRAMIFPRAGRAPYGWRRSSSKLILGDGYDCFRQDDQRRAVLRAQTRARSQIGFVLPRPQKGDGFHLRRWKTEYAGARLSGRQ